MCPTLFGSFLYVHECSISFLYRGFQVCIVFSNFQVCEVKKFNIVSNMFLHFYGCDKGN